MPNTSLQTKTMHSRRGRSALDMGDNLSAHAKPARGVIEIDALDLAIARLGHQHTTPHCYVIPEREDHYCVPRRKFIGLSQVRLVGVIQPRM